MMHLICLQSLIFIAVVPNLTLIEIVVVLLLLLLLLLSLTNQQPIMEIYKKAN